MSNQPPTPSGFQQTYERIRAILNDARSRAYRAINTAMVTAYWEIGRAIVEREQQGQQRAEYGRGLLKELSQRLSTEFGRGFDRSNLWHMRSFYLSYPNLDAVRRELLCLGSDLVFCFLATTRNKKQGLTPAPHQPSSARFSVDSSYDTKRPETIHARLPKGHSMYSGSVSLGDDTATHST